MLRLLYLFTFFLTIHSINAQSVCTPESRQKLEQSLERIADLKSSEQRSGKLALEIGQWFIGTPYVAKTLELPGEEKLVINLMGLDCTTYAESIIALVRLAQNGESSISAFEQELELIRYRNGKNEGYPSRLHYFSDWIQSNAEKGLFQDITAEIGGEPYPNKPSFMSENPKFYPQLADSKNLEAIKETEATIADRDYFFVPKEKILSLEKSIQSGDIIGITTSLKNLDMVHVGFAIEKNGRIHLLHASSKNMEVEISSLPLHDYLAGNSSQSGIMVARIVN